MTELGPITEAEKLREERDELRAELAAALQSKVVFIERSGSSAHFWIGPFGLHIFRDKSPYKRFRVQPDYHRRWRG